MNENVMSLTEAEQDLIRNYRNSSNIDQEILEWSAASSARVKAKLQKAMAERGLTHKE